MSQGDVRRPAPSEPEKKELQPHIRARLSAMASLESALRGLEAACIALEPYHQPVQLVGSKPTLEHAMYVFANNVHAAIVAGATKLGIAKGGPEEAAEAPAAAPAAPGPG